MNVDSQKTANNNDHFGIATLAIRTLASSKVYCPPHSGWEIVKRIDVASVEMTGLDADCWLFAATDLADFEIDDVAAKGLPLVIIADAEISPDWLDRADTVVLPDDDAATIASVLRSVIGPARGPQVSEFTDGTARTINALSMEASRIAERLARLAEAEQAPPQPGRVDAALVRKLIKLRRDRERFFPADIFADPAWDMLLDLAAARLEGKRVPVSSLCIAAAVPTTTALRWVRSLTEAGIFVRQVDPDDARRSHVEIAPAAADAMLAYLQAFTAVFTLR